MSSSIMRSTASAWSRANLCATRAPRSWASTWKHSKPWCRITARASRAISRLLWAPWPAVAPGPPDAPSRGSAGAHAEAAAPAPDRHARCAIQRPRAAPSRWRNCQTSVSLPSWLASTLSRQKAIIRQEIISKEETMDRSDLELVLAIRQHGSLSSAARALHVTPPVVTKRLAALESLLRVQLFQRTTRKVSPTADGDALCEHAQTLLRGFQQAEAELRERQSEPTGLIRLAATFGFGRLWVGPAVAEFQQRYPRLQIQLHLVEQ